MAYVLAVDPDVRRATTTAAALASLGLDPVAAADGVEALEHFRRRGRPALLLTELDLPRVDGFSLLRKLRALSGSPTKVIVLASSRDLRADAERMRRELGIDALMSAAATVHSLLRVGRLLLGPGLAAADSSVEVRAHAAVASAPAAPPPLSSPVQLAPAPILLSRVRQAALESVVQGVVADFGFGPDHIVWSPPDSPPPPSQDSASGPSAASGVFPLWNSEGVLLGHLSFSEAAWPTGGEQGERTAAMMREIVRELENALPAVRRATCSSREAKVA